MKPSLFLVVVFSSLVAMSAEIGQLQIAGTGCLAETGAQPLKTVANNKNRFIIPIQTATAKDAGVALARKNCTMSAVVKLNADEKLVVRDVVQKVKFRVGPGSKATANLEVFLAGQESEILKAEVEAKKAILKSTRSLSAYDVVAESECGKDVIVRANASSVAQGVSLATVNADALVLTLNIEKCAVGDVTAEIN